MSSFRYKPNKMYGSGKNITTLDTEHTKIVNSFINKRESLPEKKIELNNCMKRLDELDKIDPSTYTNDNIREKTKLKQQIKALKEEIERIDSNIDEMEYYSETMDILLDYYDEADIDTADTPKMANNIMDFFSKPQETVRKNKKGKHNKASLLDSYKVITDNEYVSKNKKKTPIKFCGQCKIEKILNQTEGIYECTECGETEIVIIESDRPNYKDPIPDNTAYAYKRINHLNEILAQFQAKESTEIPQEVYDKLLVEIGKAKIENLAKLTPKKVKQILKKLRLNKYYEHVPHIINKLNGLPPPTMSRETEEKIRQMFKAMQEPFARFCPVTLRKNFLNYNYVLYKCCELLELDQFLPCFPPLKSREKLQNHDKIWEKICGALGWEFIESV